MLGSQISGKQARKSNDKAINKGSIHCLDPDKMRMKPTHQIRTPGCSPTVDFHCAIGHANPFENHGKASIKQEGKNRNKNMQSECKMGTRVIPPTLVGS